METFAIQDLTFTYPGQERPALRRLSLTVEKGEFLALCGKSGCGKSTLLRHLKTLLTPHGVREGHILFDGRPLEEADQRQQASRIGYVLQNPDNQIVTDKVWHELAFGLESLGFPQENIRLRVAEMASFFGIQDWFMRNVSELSGGQKQLLNLAAIMAMQPDVLILDEPTSQLDPIAASEFLETVKKINRELGTTIVISEHRLDEIFPAADRVAVMDRGALLCCDTPRQVGRLLKEGSHDMFLAMPAPVQVYAGVPNGLECPLTVREGRHWLDRLFPQPPAVPALEASPTALPRETVIELKDVWFKYEKNAPDVIRGLNLRIQKGEWHAVVGGNGTGKTTMLKIINGLIDADSGRFTLGSKVQIGYYDQEHHVLHMEKTIFEEISDAYPTLTETEIRNMLAAFLFTGDDVFKLISALSGGERGRVSLAKLMLSEANFLILDEPTNHLDIASKEILEEALNSYTGTVFYVSHDRYFINQTATRILDLTNQAIVNYIGDYDYYLEKKEELTEKYAPAAAQAVTEAKQASDNKLSWQQQKEEQARQRKRENELKKVEARIEELETRDKEIDETMILPDICTNVAECAKLSKEKAAITEELEGLYEKWEELA